MVPAFNEEAYLGECLASLAVQDYPHPVEVIVVDNNSTDRTAEVARSFGVEVVTEPEPGVCQARQRGTIAARGEIIVSADADTIYSPGWLSSLARWFDDHPKTVAMGGPCYFHDGPRWGRALQQGLFGAVALIRRLGGPVLYVTATNFAFRKDMWTGYDTRLAQGGDELDLLRRLRAKGRVDFDPANPTWTSARRMEQGILYNFAVSFFYYYILGYALNRFFGRPVLGMAPAFRRSGPGAPAVRRRAERSPAHDVEIGRTDPAASAAVPAAAPAIERPVSAANGAVSRQSNGHHDRGAETTRPAPDAVENVVAPADR